MTLHVPELKEQADKSYFPIKTLFEQSFEVINSNQILDVFKRACRKPGTIGVTNYINFTNMIDKVNLNVEECGKLYQYLDKTAHKFYERNNEQVGERFDNMATYVYHMWISRGVKENLVIGKLEENTD